MVGLFSNRLILYFVYLSVHLCWSWRSGMQENAKFIGKFRHQTCRE